MRSSLWLMTAGALAAPAARAQQRPLDVRQLDHEVWTIRNGAPTGIDALAQSADGMLWMGTAAGLYYYEGVQFEAFEPPASQQLPSLAVAQLLATPDSALWIGYAFGGVSVLARGRVVSYGRRDGIPEGGVTAMARDSAGVMWVATTTGLARLAGGRWQRMGPEQGYPGGMTSDLLVDRRGTLWAPTTAGVFILPRGASRFTKEAPSLDPQGTGSGVPREAPDGSVWASSIPLGLTRLSDSAGRAVPSRRAARGLGKGYSFTIDRQGYGWIDTQRGLFRVLLAATGAGKGARARVSRPLEIEPVPLTTGFLAAPPLEDREGSIWLGTEGGLERFRETKLTPVPLPQGAGGLSLVPTAGGAVLLASYSHPLLAVQDRAVANGGVPAGMSCGYRDLRGGVWFGGPGGLWHAPVAGPPSSTRFVRVPLPRQPGAGDVQAIAQTLDGDLWVSIRGGRMKGVFRRRGNAWSLAPLPPGFGGQAALTVVADSGGRIWLGFIGDRLVSVRGDSVRVYSDGDGLKVGGVTALLVRGPRLWVGGESGLAMLDEGRFRSINATRRLRGITGIVETAPGDLWLNGTGGVTHIAAAEVRRALQDSTYRARAERLDYRDGLRGAVPHVRPLPTAIQGEDGRLWFTTTTSIAWIDPTHIRRNPLPPPVQIRAISAGGKRYETGGAVRLPARTSQIQMAYTALSFAIPDRVRFRYRLAGVDTAWVEAGTRREAFYTNLGPGSYRFHVIAANQDGVWNETGAVLGFSVAPAFYQAAWFRALLLAAFGGLLWMLYRLRVRQLALRNLRFRDAVDTMPAIAFTTLPDGTRTFVNRRWVEYTGLTAAQGAGSGWQEVVHADDLPGVLDRWRRARATGEPPEYEVRMRNATGAYRWFLVRAGALRDRRGHITAWYGVATDIEERRRSEEALAQARSELAHVARVTAVGALTASIAHEVNQPLAGIVTNASTCLRMLAAEPPNVDGARETARRTIRDGRRASEVITRLRGLFTRKAAVAEPVDLSDATREVLALSMTELRRSGVVVHEDLARSLPPILGDRVQLQQVILNLIANAADAMSGIDDRARDLWVTCDRDAGSVRVSVRDAGIGFEPQAADRLFEPFHTTKSSGMGIGLSVSRSIIERHHGRLWATPNPEYGATFTFSLPAEDAPVARQASQVSVH